MLNQLHPLYQLADKIDWESICIHASDNDSLKHEKDQDEHSFTLDVLESR